MQIGKEKKRPNIVLIVMDTARAQNFSCYGYGKETTPTLEALARDGVLYENAVAPSVWTLPCHSSIFTGLLPATHGENSVSTALDHSIPTMAEYLTNRAYQTVGFSKIHFVGRKTGLARGFQKFYEMWKIDPLREDGHPLDKFYIKIDRKLDELPYGKTDYGSRRINRSLERWFARDYSADRPFFLFINYFEPHLRFWPPMRYRSRFLEPSLRRRARTVNQDANAYNAGVVEMNGEDFAILRGLYDGEIAYTDFRIGEVVDLLRARGLFDDTIFIVTSDHGESIGEHGLMEHRVCPYQTVVHVPLLIRYPEAFPKNRRVSDLVQTTDLFPTLCHLLGDSEQPQKSGFEGAVLPPVRSHGERYTVTEYTDAKAPDSFLRKHPGIDTSVFTEKFIAIRKDRYKFIGSSAGRYQLYDLSGDAGEEKNLAADPACASVFGELRRVADDRLRRWESRAEGADSIEMDQEVIKRLEDLGYL